MSTHDYSSLGPLAELMKNPRVTEVMVMGVNDVYVEVDGKILMTPIRFKSEEELMAVIRHIVEAVGAHAERRCDEVPDRDLLAVGARRPRLEPRHMPLPQLKLGRVLDRDNALIVG